MSLHAVLQQFAADVNTSTVNLPQVQANTTTIGDIMSVGYLWAGIIAVLIVVIGGLLYVTSNGDANNIQRAKNTILYAVVGLLVVIFAFAITQLVIYFAT